MNGNISVDPLFCGIAASRNYFLRAESPCSESNVAAYCSGVRMGRFPANCTVGVRESSWGSIKSIYRDRK